MGLVLGPPDLSWVLVAVARVVAVVPLLGPAAALVVVSACLPAVQVEVRLLGRFWEAEEVVDSDADPYQGARLGHLFQAEVVADAILMPMYPILCSLNQEEWFSLIPHSMTHRNAHRSYRSACRAVRWKPSVVPVRVRAFLIPPFV